MKLIFMMVVSVVVISCTTVKTGLKNNKGDVVLCIESGGGMAGAEKAHAECVQFYMDHGYKQFALPKKAYNKINLRD